MQDQGENPYSMNVLIGIVCSYSFTLKESEQLQLTEQKLNNSLL
jgi:hypothetical protein